MNASTPPPAEDTGDAAILDLERFVPYQLSLLSNVVSQEIAEAYGDRFGLAITEWRILAVLGRFPGMSAAGVAERSAMDKVAVSRAVARLLERGLSAELKGEVRLDFPPEGLVCTIDAPAPVDDPEQLFPLPGR